MLVENRPEVSLAQGRVVGLTITENYYGGLPKPVQVFLGVPYAIPPVGDRRFRRAELPLANPDAVIDASRFGYAAPCKQLWQIGQPVEFSEDCLTVNIFRNVSGPKDKKLVPVLVNIHGGAFNRGTSSLHNTASMLAHSEEPFIGVTFNYRLGALGFLPSRVSAQEGILNLGLWDQDLLLRWVQENIGAFGGDKDDVTLAGLSAGAHSVGHHIMHYTEGVAPLFHRALIESGAPTSRAVRHPDAAIHEEQFQAFLEAVGWPGDRPEAEILPFLRGLPSQTIEAAQIAVFDRYNPSLRWAFQPVIDGELIPRKPIETWASGRWHKVPILQGFNRNEGSLYVDKTMARSDQFLDFFRVLLPLLAEEDIQTIDALYPDPLTVPDSPYRETRDGAAPQYKRIEAAYGHYAYVAPVRQTAELAAPAVPVYLYQWALVSTVLNGAQHGDNYFYEFLDPKLVNRSPAQRQLAGFYHAYLTSFITRKGEPNAITSGPYGDRPRWETYNSSADGQVAMVFGEGNEELIGGGVGTPAKLIPDTWGREESKFWWSKVDLSQQ